MADDGANDVSNAADGEKETTDSPSKEEFKFTIDADDDEDEDGLEDGD